MCVCRHPNPLLSLDSLEFATTAKTFLSEEILEVGQLNFTISVLKFLSDSSIFILLLRYGNTEWLFCFTHVLVFSCREVGLSPPKGISCVYGKNTKQK